MITRENLAKLQQSLAKDEAALVLSPENRFYLTGFPSSSGFCFFTNNELLFYTDSRYVEAAEQGVKYFTVTEEKGRRNALLGGILNERGIKKLNIEAHFVSVSQYNAYKEAFAGVDIISDGELDKTVQKFREVKTDEEVAFISTACSISDRAFLNLLPLIKEGVTERDLAAELEYQLKKCGGDGLAFETIGITGENTSKPHGVPGDNKVKKGDFLTFDFGATYKGYLSDMTRTVAFGQPTDEMIKVYDTVYKAQTTALTYIKAGAVCSEVDAVARNIIKEAGYGEYFGHGLGHCVGVEIHEMPALSPNCSDVLQVNNIITCEPGIYLPGRFGVRIEDTTVVRENGCEPLNKVQKELIIL